MCDHNVEHMHTERYVVVTEEDWSKPSLDGHSTSDTCTVSMLLKAYCHLVAPLWLTTSFAYTAKNMNGAVPQCGGSHSFDVLFVYI